MRKLILLSIILSGCLDLSALTSERCPDYKPCRSDQMCVDGTCVDVQQTIVDMTIPSDMKTDPPDLMTVDMKLDPTSDICFKTYIPKYYAPSINAGSCWMPSYWQSNNFKECKPPNCTQGMPTHCSGEMVEMFLCNSNSTNMYLYSSGSNMYVSVVQITNGATYYEYVANGANGTVCERYPKIGPTTCPDPDKFIFYSYLCENLI